VIVVFGSINLDMIFKLPSLPMPGQTLLAGAAQIEPGGKGANQAVAAALDGATVIMAGAVGRDALAEAAEAGLNRAGVDRTRIVQFDKTTGCAMIATDSAGRNQIIVAPGANLLAREAQVEDALLTQDTTLVTQMETDPDKTAALILRAKRLGARTLLNLAPAKPIARGILEALDFLVVNEDEAEAVAAQFGVAPDAASLHRALGIGVVRTLGGAGSEAVTATERCVLPVHAVEVKDTTAAGDCFTGVLAASLDRGLTLADAMERAGVAASLCCTKEGSQSSLPSRLEIDAQMTGMPNRRL
jgi:ribokinase